MRRDLSQNDLSSSINWIRFEWIANTASRKKPHDFQSTDFYTGGRLILRKNLISRWLA